LSHITADCIWRRVYHMSVYQPQTGARRDIYPCHMEHQFGSITEKLGYGSDARRGT
jgi:thymidylate synthase